MALSKFDLSLVIEALRSARCEIETLEQESDIYVTTGRLVDQLIAAEAILVKEKARVAARIAARKMTAKAGA